MAAHLTAQDDLHGWHIVDLPASHSCRPLQALSSGERQQGAGSREGGGRCSGGTTPIPFSSSIPDSLASQGVNLVAEEVGNNDGGEASVIIEDSEAAAEVSELWHSITEHYLSEPDIARQLSEVFLSESDHRPELPGKVQFYGGPSLPPRVRGGQPRLEPKVHNFAESFDDDVLSASQEEDGQTLITVENLESAAHVGLNEVTDLDISGGSGGGGAPGGGGSVASSALIDLSLDSDSGENEGEGGASRGGAALGPHLANSDQVIEVESSDDEDGGGALGGGRASDDGGAPRSASEGAPAIELSKADLMSCSPRRCTVSECNCRGVDFGVHSPIDCTGIEKVQPMDPRSRGINPDNMHRLLPPTMQKAQLKEVTLHLDKVLEAAVAETVNNELVASTLTEKLAEHGLAILRRRTLEQIIPGYAKMWEQAREELVDLLGVHGGALPEIIFHNESKNSKTVDTGDKNRSSGKIAPRGPCRILLDAVIKAVTNGNFQLLESHDGIVQASALYQKHQLHADYDTQAHHVDNRILAYPPAGRPHDDVVVANVKSMADPRKAVRSLLVNMGNGPIRFSVFEGSHKLAQFCEHTYFAHFKEVYAHCQSSGIVDGDIFGIWAEISARHLEHQFPGREPAGAATVSTDPGDLIFILGNCVHGGTADEGLRLFGNHVHNSQTNKSDPVNYFWVEDNSTELIGNSFVYAGMRRLCLPDRVGHPWKKVLSEVIKQVMAVFSSENTNLRSKNADALSSLLTAWNTEQNGWRRPDMDRKVRSIGRDLAAVQFVELCDQKRSLLVFLELRMAFLDQRSAGVGRDVRNSPLLRHAMTYSDLQQRTRRSEGITVSRPAGKAWAGYTDVVDSRRLCWTAVESPVGCVPLEAMFSDWNEKGELTEQFRWGLLALFRGLEDLWIAGFHMNVFDPTMFVYDKEADKMVLVFAGLGQLGQSDAMVANRASITGPVAMTRRNTSFCLDTGKVGTVDLSYLKDLQELAAAEQEAAQQAADNVDIVEEGAGDDLVEEVGARELLPHELAREKVKLRGKKVGCSRVPTVESFLDEKLRASVFGETEVEFETVRDEAKQTDLHQVLLWLATMFSRRTWSRDFKRDLLPLLAPELGDDAAIDMMLEKCFQVARKTRKTPGYRSALQPAGRRRFAQLLALGLREGTRDTVLHELSLMPGVSHPIYSPDQEGLLAGEGIPVLLERYPIKDVEFMGNADKSIRKAGLRADDANRRVCLINEGEKGVGVQVVGRFELLEFFGFYIGIAGEGRGRFVVSTPGQGEVGERCDAAPCKDLPLPWFIDNGVPCPFINAADSAAEANIHLYREHLFYHCSNGKKLVCIPMGVCKVIEDKSFASWYYSFVAVSGRAMTF